MHLLNTILLCSAVASATPRIFDWANSIHQLAARKILLDSTLARMTNAQALASVKKETCYNGTRIPWPQNDLPPPLADKPIQQLHIFKKPETAPNTLTIHNYCNYPIYYVHWNGPQNIGQGVIKAHDVFTSPLRGSVIKASKTPDLTKVVLIEYFNDKATKKLWYNLSLVKCLGVNPRNGMYTTDTSACAGHESGLQFGNKQVMSYQCAPGWWCDDQAYLYDENLCKVLNPVSTCSPKDGVTMEFCASKRR
ncbi:hypothetical protein HBI80_149820 [Parastagonospora nodorum]|nr:hypothetical protein HBH52_099830 [Parastagonospora nodorum]KAH4048840.1 hypothetical protein HBH49_151870 [Parastagonospora nodorum]KAH4851835.1 hypothetical protein HBH75_118310 [Parastagonospora nodorum]KAH4901135.1 hypothetical protein HBI80_149820 [Parastagonospora nodorum]KAH4928571.1 hypothetical protein HBI79_131050 [Parastagonospora nodorum]